MPIRVDDDLPVKKILEDENIFVMGSDRAIRQDIRPLDILILNLMPLKQDAELQLMRSLSNTPLQVNISLIRTMTYESKHAPKGHLERFYTDFSSIKDRKWDGFIITGAPIEKMEFEDVEYWDELKEIMDRVSCKEKLGVCFDTCHVNDAGYDLVNDLSGVFEKFDKVIGTDQIGVFHINDSKNALGAGKDRHENIGFGNIGYDTLRQIIYMEQFENIPKILETPYVKDPENSKKSYAPYKFEIEMIKKGEFNTNLQNEILQNGR